MKVLKFCSVLFVCLFSVMNPLNLGSEEPSSIVGKWKLNEKESDDAREKIHNAMQDKMKSRGMGQPGGGKFGGRRESISGGMKDFIEPPELITITFNAPEVRITNEEGKEQVFYIDGRKTERAMGEDRRATITSKWEDDSLVIESQTPNGGKITQTYYLSSSGKQLYVKLRLNQ